MAIRIADQGDVDAPRDILAPMVSVGYNGQSKTPWTDRFKAMVATETQEFTDEVDAIPTESSRRELAVKLAESILIDLRADCEERGPALLGDTDVWAAEGNPLQEALRPSYLMWMCEMVILKKDEWVSTRLHRWIGYVQAGLLLSGVTGLEHEKDRVRDLKKLYPED